MIPSRGNYLRVVAPLATGKRQFVRAARASALRARRRHRDLAAFAVVGARDAFEVATGLALRRGARNPHHHRRLPEHQQADALATLLDWEHPSEDEEDGGPGG